MNKKPVTVLNPIPAKFYRSVIRKTILFSKIIFVIVFLLSCVGIGFIINEYLATHTFTWQEPVVVRTPLVIERIKEYQIIEASDSAQLIHNYEPTSLIPAAYAHSDAVKEALVIEQTKNPAIVWRVYMLESTFGRGDGCREKGKFNGFGFGQPDSKMANGTGACFDTFEEVVSKVDNWFTEKLKDMEIREALCVYNTGSRTSDCPYFQRYLTTL